MASPEARAKFVEQLCESWTAVCTELFKKPAQPALTSAEGSAVTTSDIIKQVAEQLRNDAAKVGIMAGSAQSQAEWESLLNSLHQTVLALVTSLHGLTHDAGPSLSEELKKAAEKVVAVCSEMLKGLPSADAAAVNKLVGKVWAQCDEVKKGPLDNKTALFRRLAAAMVAIKDTVREMSEISAGETETIQESEQEGKDEEDEVEGSAAAGRAGPEGGDASSEAAGAEAGSDQAAAAGSEGKGGEEGEGKAGAGEGDDDDDDDEGEGEEGSGSVYEFEAGEMSAHDRAVLGAAQQLMDLAVRTLQAVSRPLLRASGFSKEEVEGWESLVWHSKSLQRGVEDLGAAMYPPQDLDEVEGATEGLLISAECMLDEVLEANAEAEGLRQAVTTVQQELEVAKSRMEAAVARSRQGE